ncbi:MULTISPECIES: hypothetical protein [unclassified Streptomyces]|uniref:hypothetical protein n=1 Tax=unclassified Streptomyces TaxID=2593676 RepID=UPI002253BDBF|nr:hypothetical protein [Streptomyces sp. NBC_01363]MCX4734580.1 hypothetical protein [Streptomyces sp. NBC_01363]
MSASELLTVQQLGGLVLVLAGVVLGRPTRAERGGSGQEPAIPAADDQSVPEPYA